MIAWRVVGAGDDGIKVRAVCPAGHETVTTAPRNRVTWRGQCHTEGCEHRIVARKVLDPPGTAPATEPSDPPKPKKKIRKVAAYRGSDGPASSTEPAAPGFEPGPDPAGTGGNGGPAGLPADATTGADDGPGSGLIDDKPPARQSAVRRAAAWRKQRRERLAAEVDDGKPWTIPGIYR